MAYYEFTIVVPEESKDALVHRMSDMGCLGVTEYGEKIVAYFRDTHDIIKLRDGLTSFKKILKESGLDPDFTFDYFYLSERDWNESWKKKLQPIDVGDVFSVLPPWEEERAGRINIVIDPGMAFGTGHHHTTKTCLLLINRFSCQCAKGRFLDVGTGTGILAIGASKVGFKEVVGVDIDPLAIDASLRNIGHNRLDNIVIREGDITVTDGTFDFIAANLLSEVITSIAPEIAARLRGPGIVLLSGIIVGQEEGVMAAMETLTLKCVEKVVEDMWVSLVLGFKWTAVGARTVGQ